MRQLCTQNIYSWPLQWFTGSRPQVENHCFEGKLSSLQDNLLLCYEVPSRIASCFVSNLRNVKSINRGDHGDWSTQVRDHGCDWSTHVRDRACDWSTQVRTVLAHSSRICDITYTASNACTASGLNARPVWSSLKAPTRVHVRATNTWLSFWQSLFTFPGRGSGKFLFNDSSVIGRMLLRLFA